MKATFAGANIKGTPAMKAASVRHDLRVIKAEADVFGVQEFKWAWYWRVAMTVLFKGWAAYPGIRKGAGHPIDGAQAIFWKRQLFKRVAAYGIPAFDFKLSSAGIMDNRWIRAVLLKAVSDGFTAWYMSTHFVVGGDGSHDSPRRKEFMRQNLARLDQMLTHLRGSGYPIMGEMDANIRRGTWSYDELMRILKKHGAMLHGDLGVEYAFTIPGQHGEFVMVHPRVIPTSKLKTDHEVRVLDWDGRAR